jgi:hypothetical protein
MTPSVFLTLWEIVSVGLAITAFPEVQISSTANLAMGSTSDLAAEWSRFYFKEWR